MKHFSDCFHDTSGYIAHLNGRVTELAECTGLENRRRETYRGFESHPFRQLEVLRSKAAEQEAWRGG